ncbi:MAG: PrpF family protein [Rhodospirillaceae bacterium]|nr:PrpF family protein [Rhodospirillaceae bacterium]
MSQLRVPAVYMRGGTSRAIMFRSHDLPADRTAWAAIFLAALGSPDPSGRQLDGLGGGITSLSKAAVVGPSTRADADVDYTFVQVAVKEPLVQYKANCGNISAAVGPFAVDEGLVVVTGGDATVRIHNTNTGKIIVAKFPIADGKAAVDGDFVLQGVAGSGAPIQLSFLDPGGAVTGKLLPTGKVRDRVKVPGVGFVDMSLVDAANPVAFVAARDLGLYATETPDQLSHPELLKTYEEIRVAAAVHMGIADETEARTKTKNVPFIGLVAAPVLAQTLGGKTLKPDEMHITVRMISSGVPHKATPLTAAMCLAVAVRTPGTIPHQYARAADGDILIAHPSGILPVAANVQNGVAESAVVYRTARRLMEGAVLVPKSRLG